MYPNNMVYTRLTEMFVLFYSLFIQFLHVTLDRYWHHSFPLLLPRLDGVGVPRDLGSGLHLVLRPKLPTEFSVRIVNIPRTEHGEIIRSTKSVKRRFEKISQSQRRPLLGISPG